MIEGVAIYAEGRADLAVLTNIIKGVLGDDVTIYPRRPELDFDETDLHEMRPEQFSTYALVIEDCKNHAKFAAVLDAVAEERLIVIHFDAAEAHRSEFGLPAGPEETLRARLVQRIKEWTCLAHHPHLRYAIAVMETEAWLLAHCEPGRDSSRVRDPKKRFRQTVGPNWRKDFGKLLGQRDEHNAYDKFSKELRKRKVLRDACKRNESLRQFCESLGPLEG